MVKNKNTIVSVKVVSHLGSSLLEVMVSLSIISIVLLGFDSSQLIALHETTSAYQAAIANQQLEFIDEELKAAMNADTTDLINDWVKQTELLLNANAAVESHYPSYQISISWKASNLPCFNLSTEY